MADKTNHKSRRWPSSSTGFGTRGSRCMCENYGDSMINHISCQPKYLSPRLLSELRWRTPSPPTKKPHRAPSSSTGTEGGSPWPREYLCQLIVPGHPPCVEDRQAPPFPSLTIHTRGWADPELSQAGAESQITSPEISNITPIPTICLHSIS